MRRRTIAILRRPMLATAFALGVMALPLPLLHMAAQAADPTPGASATTTSDPSQTPAPSVSPGPSAAPSPSPTATPSPTGTSTPPPAPTPSGSPAPSGSPTPTPTPTASPTPTPSAPASLNLYVTRLFRYQDPNYTACTAASTMDMLNFIAATHSGGANFRWHVNVTSRTRDAILRFERAHDTLARTAHGSDPHGWRNALNYYGWGSATLNFAQQVYVDRAYASYGAAIREAVRQMALTRKPIGMLGWAGKHAQMITGYYGLHGDPLAKNADGSWTNQFSVDGLYVSDPLRRDGFRNRRVPFMTLARTTNFRLRFRRYAQNDSPYDDPYTPGYRASRREWYGKFVLILPIR